VAESVERIIRYVEQAFTLGNGEAR
jgi:hypothetical protein